MLIGTNWLLGYSHKTHPMNHMICERNNNAKAMCDIICAFAKYGIDALMAPITTSQPLMEALNDAEQKLGKRIIRIDTPTINVDDNAAARAEAGQKIRDCAKAGADFCLIHHTSAEALVNKNLGQISAPAGLSFHDPRRGYAARPVRAHAGIDHLFR